MPRGKGCRGAREWEGRDGDGIKEGNVARLLFTILFDRRGEDLAGGLETTFLAG